MKAIIMAGGEGKRLKAVTGESPKPLAPLLGRPIMEHIILLLKQHGFCDICAAVKYRAEDIMAYFGDGTELGVKLQYSVEETALGTAGGVKNCEDFIGDDNVLVISGDAACDFDFSALMATHSESKAAVTLALHKSPYPLEYGLAVTDKGGFIRCFIEKPDWPHVVTDLVNTGIYVLAPSAVEAIPRCRLFDFAKNLFPLLMDRGERLFGAVMSGYWCDIGTPLSYYKCCVDALEGRLRLSPTEGFILPEKKSVDSEGGIICTCGNRAALMGALSELFLELDSDYSDGICLDGSGYKLRITPCATQSAIRVRVDSDDAEFAQALALSAKAVIDALNL